MYMTARLKGEAPASLSASVVGVGNKIYSFGRSDTAGKAHDPLPMQLHFLDTEKLSWVKVLTNPGEEKIEPLERYGHSAVVFNEKIYIWGGKVENGFMYNPLSRDLGDLLCFDTATSTWSVPEVSGDIPKCRFAHFAFVFGHRMFIIGGYEASLQRYSPLVFALDLHTMNWSFIGKQPDHLVKRRNIFPCAVGVCIYIFYGEVWKWATIVNTETNEWSTLDCRRTSFAIVRNPLFVYQNSVYAFVHMTYFSFTWELYRFSLDTRTWLKVNLRNMSRIPRTRMLCQVINSRVFMYHHSLPWYYNEILHSANAFIIDLNPSLRNLCLQAVVEYELNPEDLPAVLKAEVSNMKASRAN